MGSYEITFRSSAVRDLRRLSQAVVQRMIRRIEALADLPLPRQSLKLRSAERLYRMRVGDFRVIYEVDEEAKTIIISHIRHRSEAYREV